MTTKSTIEAKTPEAFSQETDGIEALIVRVHPRGLAFAEDSHGQVYAFNFDQIHGYHGEQAIEIGLIPGATVLLSLSAHTVASVKIPNREMPHRAR